MLWRLRVKDLSRKIVTVKRSSCNLLSSLSVCSLKGRSDGPMFSAPLQCCISMWWYPLDKHEKCSEPAHSLWRVLTVTGRPACFCHCVTVMCEFRMLLDTLWTLFHTNCNTPDSSEVFILSSAHIDCDCDWPVLLSNTYNYYKACLLRLKVQVVVETGTSSADTTTVQLQ